jgi:hypothetical protein
VVHRADGGPTSLTNLQDWCWFHHHVVLHQMGWKLDVHPDGTSQVTSPDGKIIRSHGPPVLPGTQQCPGGRGRGLMKGFIGRCRAVSRCSLVAVAATGMLLPERQRTPIRASPRAWPRPERAEGHPQQQQRGLAVITSHPGIVVQAARVCQAPGLPPPRDVSRATQNPSPPSHVRRAPSARRGPVPPRPPAQRSRHAGKPAGPRDGALRTRSCRAWHGPPVPARGSAGRASPLADAWRGSWYRPNSRNPGREVADSEVSGRPPLHILIVINRLLLAI